MDTNPPEQKDYVVFWPEPPHARLLGQDAQREPCEIELRNGRREVGELIHFTGRDSFLVFRPKYSHAQHNRKITVPLNLVKQMRLTKPVATAPIDDVALGQHGTVIAPSEIQVYNIEFIDGEILSGETAGYVKQALGLFLYFQADEQHLGRAFIPDASIAYFQVGDPIGKLLVDEHVVSEAQLKEAVEKQQEMRKMVLGDYLLEQGLITRAQLDSALVHQQERPSLRLGEALIEMGALTGEALHGALSRQRANRGRPLGQILVDMGVLDTETLQKVHARKTGLPFVNLKNFRISPEALQLIPMAVARRLGIVPLAVEDGDLIVAAGEPPESAAMAELGLLARTRVVPVAALAEEIQAKLDEFYGPAKASGAAEALTIDDPDSIRFAAEEEITVLPLDDPGVNAVFEDGELLELREAATLESDRILLEVAQRMLRSALKGGVLDIQIDTRNGQRHTRIRYRNDPGPV